MADGHEVRRAVALYASPDAPIATHADFCGPFVAAGPLLEAVRAQLARTRKLVAAVPEASAA